MEQNVSPEEAAIKDKKAYYELLVRQGFYLPKLNSKFVNQRTLIFIRDKKIFVPTQQQVVFRLCCTPPTKEVMIDKYITYAEANKLHHGIDRKKENYPDKEWLILCISTLTNGTDEIFGRNYYPENTKMRVNAKEPFTYLNNDGFLSNIPRHLLGNGSRSVKLQVLSKEEKLNLKVMRASKRVKKETERKEKFEKEWQASKITKALFGDNSTKFDAEQERARIKAELQQELEQQVQQHLQNKEA